MESRYTTKAAVMLFLIKEINGIEYVLLQLRQKTGYADDLWDASASGHLEANESITAAAIRETLEEININISKENLEFLSVDHKKVMPNSAYFNFHFICRVFTGTPQICEPHKCKALEWFPLDELPENIISERKEALNNYRQQIKLTEIDW